jgi:hypothetical protein
MVRAIEQPWLVVGFEKRRLKEGQRNGALSVEIA